MVGPASGGGSRDDNGKIEIDTFAFCPSKAM